MDADFPAVLERAIKLLAIRARSRRELADRLCALGYSPAVVEQVDSHLAELGLVNDEELALSRVRHLLGSGHSSRLIRHDLERRGLPDEAVGAAMELALEVDDSGRAVELAERRARSCASLPYEKAFARVARYLCSRGYEPEVAEEACRRTLGPRE